MRKHALLFSFILLAACSSATQSPVPPRQIDGASTIAKASGNGYKLLYSFKGMPDGATPMGNLTVFEDALYGVTAQGGNVDSLTRQQTGTVFRITPNGDEKVIYAFGGADKDADSPNAPPIVVKGNFYGATPYGGTNGNYGAIYKLTAAGKETLLYSFVDYIKGTHPFQGLIYVNGLLYGAATYGGPTGNGLIYSVSLSGKFKVLYAFRGGLDGAYPYSSLVYADGKLWGTTVGASSKPYGTVFSMTLSGKETPIYQFKGPPDSGFPSGGLTLVGNLFYGTAAGGAKQGGTIYSIDANGKENVLHSFPYYGGPNGLTYVDGMFYGATYRGGAGIPGHGEIFQANKAGKTVALYKFTGAANGKQPSGQLTAFDGRLYGVTEKGGQYGYGTVFSVPEP